jgi:hypothetical protein
LALLKTVYMIYKDEISDDKLITKESLENFRRDYNEK